MELHGHLTPSTCTQTYTPFTRTLQVVLASASTACGRPMTKCALRCARSGRCLSVTQSECQCVATEPHVHVSAWPWSPNTCQCVAEEPHVKRQSHACPSF
jgi:hypothetical protein